MGRCSLNETRWIRGTLLCSPYDTPLPSAWIEVSGRQIRALWGPEVVPPAGDLVIDHGSDFILPGFIDTHCHLVYTGDGTWSGNYIQDHTQEELKQIAAENARKSLLAGITTLRDLGAPGTCTFDLRSEVAGDRSYPRMLLSGAPLTCARGHGADLGGEVRSADEMHAMIRQLVAWGADLIKVIASGGGTLGTSPGAAAFSFSELLIMAEEAHRWGRAIVAHATCPEAVRDALLAGYDGVEHANFWSGETLENRYDVSIVRLMEREGVYIAPTLQASYRTLHELRSQTEAERSRRGKLVRDALINFRRMQEHSIRFVAGTDAGYMINPFGDLHIGLRLMVENGMSERDALQTATGGSAEALGLGGSIGRIAPGYEADLVVLRGDPTMDITACGRVNAVYRGGHPVSAG
jgi:imidazolonepropionase-like amidohydrolase